MDILENQILDHQTFEGLSPLLVMGRTVQLTCVETEKREANTAAEV